HQVLELGGKPYFVNAFPEQFFEKARVRNRWSCCTLMARSAGLRLNSVPEVLSGAAITAEITQEYWHRHLGVHVPEINVDEAADRVINQAIRHDVTLMEYYLTDKAGHGQNPGIAAAAIERLD